MLHLQLGPLVELLGNSSLDGTRGRHVLRTLFFNGRNLTIDDVLRYILRNDVRNSYGEICPRQRDEERLSPQAGGPGVLPESR